MTAGNQTVAAGDRLGGEGASGSGRVLLLAPQPFYDDRGTPIAVRLVVEALGELGREVDLLTYPVGRDIELPRTRVFRSANPFGIRQVPVGLCPQKLLLDINLVDTFRRRLRQGRYACVHALEEAAFPAVWLGRRHGVPVLYDMQSSLPDQLRQHRLFTPGPLQRAMLRAEGWLIRRADLIVASAGLGRHVRQFVPAARVREWRYPSQLPRAHPAEVAALRTSLGIPAASRVVVYCGTFEPYQGLPELVRAAAVVRQAAPDTCFLLVGGTPKAVGELRRQADALGLGASMHLLPRQRREEIPACLALADVLVSTRAYGENLPLKVVDYLAAGRPIVASGIDCHRPLLDRSRARLVAHEPERIARAILELLSNPALAGRLAGGARAFAAEHLTWRAFVRSVGMHYADLEGRARVALVSA